jgi:hypothetical protein
MPMTRKTRPISWVKAALKEFERFPMPAQSICLAALTIAAEGGKADIVKPFKGLGQAFLKSFFLCMETLFGLFTQSKLRRNFGFYMHFGRNRRRE